MKENILKSFIFLMAILFMALFFSPILKIEGFTGGDFPASVDKPILNDYKLIGKNDTSNKNYSDIWSDYPVFSLGSFKQLTNNLRYHKNPDNGQCIRADFCNAIYYDKKNIPSNEVHPLPPAEEGDGARVGYFRSEPNELFFSIPTNENILY